MFQSAPAIAGGRSVPMGSVGRDWRCFNPRPPLLAGDPWGKLRLPWVAPCFNPRPPLLAGDPASITNCPPLSGCFNPRPPLLAGDPEAKAAKAEGSGVSIRARHCWRAIPVNLHLTNPRLRFHSATAIAGGRSTCCCYDKLRHYSFQSAPAIAGGRSASRPRPCCQTIFSCIPANLAMATCVCKK